MTAFQTSDRARRKKKIQRLFLSLMNGPTRLDAAMGPKDMLLAFVRGLTDEQAADVLNQLTEETGDDEADRAQAIADLKKLGYLREDGADSDKTTAAIVSRIEAAGRESMGY